MIKKLAVCVLSTFILVNAMSQMEIVHATTPDSDINYISKGDPSEEVAAEPSTGLNPELNLEPEQLLPCGGQIFNVSTTEMDLSKAQIPDFNAFVEELVWFPNLQKVILCGSNLSNDQMEALTIFFPNTKFVWNVVLAGYWTIRTDQIAFSCNKGPGPRVTDKDVEIFKYCPDLQLVDVGHNYLTNLSFVKYLPKLRCLIVSDGRVSDISDIKYCPDLLYFEAWFCRIKDITPVQYLVNLMDFNVAHNWACNDITPLLHLPRLERIYMSYCNISQASINKLKQAHPNARIEMVEYHADWAGWRTVQRYYDMRKMFTREKFTLLDSFASNYDRLSYFEKVFNYEYYVTNYPDIVKEVGTDPVTLLYYYLNKGILEGQQGCESFNLFEYTNMHPELVASYGSNYNKYIVNYINS